MKNIIKLGAILFLITAIAGGILAFSNELTKDRIEELAVQASDEARKAVFSDADSFEAVDESILSEITSNDENVLEIHSAIDGSGETVGYVIKTVSKEGYGGNIEVITGLSVDGQIVGMQVGSNAETPGLGTNAANPEFQDQFKGKSTSSAIEVSKSEPGENEIQALTGATITSKAVTNGVNTAVEAFNVLNK